jgi:hypothetical protein
MVLNKMMYMMMTSVHPRATTEFITKTEPLPMQMYDNSPKDLFNILR